MKQGAVFAALLAGAVADAQAGDYSKVYFFGDSITDSGSFINFVAPSTTARYTPKPGTVWTENVGANYGKPVTTAFRADISKLLVFPLNSSGNNFAVGDARVNAAPPDSPLALNLPSVKMQVDGFLARGGVDSNALYALWAGGNDIFAQVALGTGAPWTNAQAALVTAANDSSSDRSTPANAAIRAAASWASKGRSATTSSAATSCMARSSG